MKPQNPNSKCRYQKGFTLIELLVVISIIGVLASIGLASLSSARQKADDTRRTQDMEQMRNALEIYASKHNGNYPVIAYSNPVTNEKFASVENDSIIQRILSLISEKAQAAGRNDHSGEPACAKFDSLAASLIADKDLSSVPVDPNDAATVNCYKAWTSPSGDMVAVYTYSWKKYDNISVGLSEPANRQIGILVDKQGQITREKIAAVCSATRAVFGDSYAFPVINPHDATSLCDGSATDGFVADVIVGISTGQETIITSSYSGDIGAACQTATDCISGYCPSGTCQDPTSGTCSDSTYSTESDCTSNGSCSDSLYSNQSDCTSRGSCSDPAYSNESDCSNTGYCSDTSYSDQYWCTNSTSNGTCSDPSYSDEANCQYYGYCADTGTSNVPQSSCTGYGYCSGGGYGDQASCEANGYCSDGNYYDQYSCTNSGYGSGGYCSDYNYSDEYSCTNNGYCTDSAYTDYYTCQDFGNTWYNNSWYNYDWYSNSWTSYYWTGQSGNWSQNTWTPGSNNIWTPHTWTPDVWTPNTWTPSQ